MRLTEIAERLADLEGRDADEVHIRLRNPRFKEMLYGEPGDYRNAPVEYPTRELFRARLLLAAFDCGLSTTAELAEVNHALGIPPAPGGKHPASARTGGGANYPGGLDCIVRGTEAGEEWSIIVRFTRTAAGERRAGISVVWNEWKRGEGRGSRVLDRVHGETHLGTLTIPASDLIRPLLDSAD